MERKTVLCVIDVQNDFITGSLANEDAQKKIHNIVNKINSMNPKNCERIILTYDTHDSNYLNTREGKKLPVEHCIEDTDGWLIEESVYDAIIAAEERGIKLAIFKKPTFGSLDMMRYVDTFLRFPCNCDFEILGFCTDICVITNALLLKSHVYEDAAVTVISDCCAGVTPETHEAALKVMSMCQINVI